MNNKDSNNNEMGNRYVDITGIQEILPHRYPFLLVDAITDYQEGKYGVGIKNVTMNEYFFQGHFPGKPVMPGVLIIEALAQVGAFVVLSMPENRGKIAYFGSITNAKFKKSVLPGHQLVLTVDVINLKARGGKATATAKVGEHVAAVCEFMFMFGAQ